MAPPTGYHDLASLEAAVAGLAHQAGGRAVTFGYGRSVQGRDLRGVTIAGPGRRPDDGRTQVMVIANIHGVEVISSEVALALLQRLCAVDLDDAEAALLDVADVTVLPVTNPDARVRALASLARPVGIGPRRNAHGVDLNRNWPFPLGSSDHWTPMSGTGIRLLPWYRGEAPLSEPETRGIADVASRLRPVALCNLHSSAGLLTHPWSSKSEPPADVEGFVAMCEAFAAAQTRTPRYAFKQSSAWYPILGASNDWFHDTFGTLAITVETSRRGEAVRGDWRLARWFFWFANPLDPADHAASDAAGCLAALRAAVDHRTRAGDVRGATP